METINTVAGKAPETTAQKAPFEIIIRTTDPEYLAHGAIPERHIPCDGYVLLATVDGDRTHHITQGRVNQLGIMQGIAHDIDRKDLFIAAAMGAFDHDEG